MAKDTERDAIETVFNGLARLSEPERQRWVTMLATTAICVIQGTYGRQFTAGFLDGARRALDDPKEALPITVTEHKLQ